MMPPPRKSGPPPRTQYDRSLFELRYGMLICLRDNLQAFTDEKTLKKWFEYHAPSVSFHKIYLCDFCNMHHGITLPRIQVKAKV